jgi:2-succinyl-6-hydroxy-2,4-cyclohexadiene-1-carboxylate synthase
VFESTSLGIETEEDRDARRNADDQWAERFETEPIERVLRDWYQRSVFSSLASRPELAKRILAMRSRNESAGVAHALRRLGAGSVPSVRGRLGDFKMPVLFIAGADDTKYVDEVQNAAGLCPQGRAVIVPGSGHCPHLENPDGFCGVVREFLSDTRC